MNRLSGFLASALADTVEVILPTGGILPVVGLPIQLTVCADSMTSVYPATVQSIETSFGSLDRITLRLGTDVTNGRPGNQRRANSRFCFGPAFPLFCFLRHPTDDRLV